MIYNAYIRSPAANLTLCFYLYYFSSVITFFPEFLVIFVIGFIHIHLQNHKHFAADINNRILFTDEKSKENQLQVSWHIVLHQSYWHRNHTAEYNNHIENLSKDIFIFNKNIITITRNHFHSLVKCAISPFTL